MSKEDFQVFEAIYKMKTPFEDLGGVIDNHKFTLSLITLGHIYQRGNLRIIFEGVKAVTCETNPTFILYPGHAAEIIAVSELAVDMKRGKLGGQKLEDAIEVTGESIYIAATRARSASAIFRQNKGL